MSPFEFILVFAATLALSIVCIPLIIRVAALYQLYDVPHGGSVGEGGEQRRIHTNPIPRLGGVAIFLSFFATHYFLLMKAGIGSIIFASAFIFVIGLIDDLRPLPAMIRLLSQLSAAAWVVINNQMIITQLTFGPETSIAIPYIIGVALSIFIIVGAINTINMIDGMDGLAGGVVIIGVLLLSLIYFIHTKDLTLVMAVSLPMIAAILGFLKFNTYPASIFMGDSGSNWLGFMVGVLVLICLSNIRAGFSADNLLLENMGTSIAPPFLLSVILCFSIPIIDTFTVIVDRIRRGVNPTTAGKNHFHHTLLRLGLSHPQCVITIYFLALAVGIIGILPVAFSVGRSDLGKHIIWAPYIAGIFLFSIILSGLTSNTDLVAKLSQNRLMVSSSTRYGRRVSAVILYWQNFNKYLTYSILMILPVFAGIPPQEVGYAAVGGAILLFGSFFMPQKSRDFFDSLVLALSAGILLVGANQNIMQIAFQGQVFSVQFLYNQLFILLFVSTFLFILVTLRKKYFIVTPSDFLLVTIPLIFLVIPNPYNQRYYLSTIALRCLVLFMSFRVFARRNNHIFFNLRIITFLALVYVVLTSLFGFRILY